MENIQKLVKSIEAGVNLQKGLYLKYTEKNPLTKENRKMFADLLSQSDRDIRSLMAIVSEKFSSQDKDKNYILETLKSLLRIFEKVDSVFMKDGRISPEINNAPEKVSTLKIYFKIKN